MTQAHINKALQMTGADLTSVPSRDLFLFDLKGLIFDRKVPKMNHS